MTELAPLLGYPIINSKSSYTLSNGDKVVTLEYLNLSTNGIFLEFSMPTIPLTYDEVYRTLAYVGISDQIGNAVVYVTMYYSQSNNISYDITVNDIQIITGNIYTPGDTFSMYLDGARVFFNINGNSIRSETFVAQSTSIYQFVSWAISYNNLTTFDQVRFYPTGLLGLFNYAFDASLGSRLFVGSDVSINGNLYINGPINPGYNPTALTLPGEIGYSITSDISSIDIPIGVWLVQLQLGYYAGISQSYSNTMGIYPTVMLDDISLNFGSGIVLPQRVPRITNTLPVAYTDLNVDYSNPVAPNNDPSIYQYYTNYPYYNQVINVRSMSFVINATDIDVNNNSIDCNLNVSCIGNAYFDISQANDTLIGSVFYNNINWTVTRIA